MWHEGQTARPLLFHLPENLRWGHPLNHGVSGRKCCYAGDGGCCVACWVEEMRLRWGRSKQRSPWWPQHPPSLPERRGRTGAVCIKGECCRDRSHVVGGRKIVSCTTYWYGFKFLTLPTCTKAWSEDRHPPLKRQKNVNLGNTLNEIPQNVYGCYFRLINGHTPPHVGILSWCFLWHLFFLPERFRFTI